MYRLVCGEYKEIKGGTNIMAKKVTVTKLVNLIKDEINVARVEGLDADINVKKNLSFEEAYIFVREAVSACVTVETAEYRPEMKEFCIRTLVLELYAGLSLPTDIDKHYKLLFNTNIYDEIAKHVDQTQLQMLRKAIDEKIEYYKAVAVNAGLSQLNQILDNMKNFAEMSEEALGGIDQSQFANVFDTLSKLNNIEQGDIVAKLVEEYKKE